MHFFTSISNNYLPKARVLAKSVRQHCKDVKFSVILSDKIPKELILKDEPFDEILTIYDLNLSVGTVDTWIFIHSVVEICTAVKGQALVNFLESGSEKVVYLDPDIAVFDDLNELECLLDEHSVILTPHQSEPEQTEMDVLNNEVCSLKHGIYNFGFFAVRNSTEGLRFARWWRDRLMKHCFDDIPNGIFTDQRWGDFVPAFFEDSYILREPNYNVSTWNLTNRNVTKRSDFSFFVNGKPLQFYHFSGFDSGAQEIMLNVYGKDNPALWELRNWYIQRIAEEGQEKLGNLPSFFGYFSNGETVTAHHRYVLRNRPDVVKYLAGQSPYDVDAEKSYYNWYCYSEDTYIEESRDHLGDSRRIIRDLRKQVANLQHQCEEKEQDFVEVKKSLSWRLTTPLRRVGNLFKG